MRTGIAARGIGDAVPALDTQGVISMTDYSFDLMLVFTEERLFADDTEPTRFVSNCYGDIMLMTDGNSEITRQIGSFSTCIVNLQDAIAEGESLLRVFDFDVITQEMFQELYALDGRRFKRKVLNAACANNCALNPNLLIVDRLFVDPEHRGYDVGSLALRALIRRLRIGVDLVAIKAFPLQFDSRLRDDPDTCTRLGLDRFSQTQSLATAKLRKYCKRLGFKRVPGSDVMVRSHLAPLPGASSSVVGDD